MNYEIEIICNSLLCLGALVGFIYSLIKFFKPKKALYKKMVACALGCGILCRAVFSVSCFWVPFCSERYAC